MHDVDTLKEFRAKDAEIAKYESEKYADGVGIELYKYIDGELNMVESYLTCAVVKTGDEHDLFKVISRDELNHAEKLMLLADSSINPLSVTDPNKIIWEYLKEGFKDRHIKLKAN